MHKLFYQLILLVLAVAVSCANLGGVYDVLDGTEYVYQLPPAQIHGVLFAAHGCSHSSTDWWPRSDLCTKCTGLPVEKSIVREALKRNLLVIAVSAQNRDHKCWSSGDIATASSVINRIYKTKLNSDYSLPLYLLGASSGGSFVGILPKSKTLKPKVSAVCVQISAVRDHLNVPVLFVLMRQDEYTMSMVQDRADHGYYPTHKTLVCEPKPITPGYFAAHGAVRSVMESEIIQRTLLENGFLVPDSLLLREDPRISHWRQVLTKLYVYGQKRRFMCVFCAFMFAPSR